MARLPLLETNVFLRHILADHPDHSQRATAYLQRIERGEIAVRTTDTVIFETVFTLERFYKVPRSDIRDQWLPLITLPGIRLTGKRAYRHVFDLYIAQRSLSFADCFHAVLVQQRNLPAIISFDRGFDRLPGIIREEP
jgi:predicted nucleic acid-binding protein